MTGAMVSLSIAVCVFGLTILLLAGWAFRLSAENSQLQSDIQDQHKLLMRLHDQLEAQASQAKHKKSIIDSIQAPTKAEMAQVFRSLGVSPTEAEKALRENP